MMDHTHIVKSYEKELNDLKNLIHKMGNLALSQFEAAIASLTERDADLASSVIEGDKELDRYEQKIDHEAIKILALRQPMAQDLRAITSSIKIAAALERIGDYSRNIARRAITLSKLPPVGALNKIPQMGAIASTILKQIIEAHDKLDVDIAIAAWHEDDQLDRLYDHIYPDLLDYMMKNPTQITAATHLLFAAKNIERIADHATNIAGNIHYMVTATPLDESRARQRKTVHSLMGPTLPPNAIALNEADSLQESSIKALPTWQIHHNKNGITRQILFEDFQNAWGALTQIAMASIQYQLPIDWKNRDGRLQITIANILDSKQLPNLTGLHPTAFLLAKAIDQIAEQK